MAEISDLLGDVIIRVTKTEYEIEFLCISGKKYKIHHKQDCCESVYIKDITGDLQDLLDFEVLVAEEVSRQANSDECSECGTWTFYKLATIKANVTISWLGESNGYYSESVDFIDIEAEDY